MSTAKSTILLVEDEPSLINLYRIVLSKSYQVDIVDNYERAEQYLNEHKPDLILLDIIIPAKSNTNLNYSQKIGLNLLKKIKQIPVIVITNLDSREDRELAQRLGAKDFVVKANILPQELLAKINKLLKR